jgi:hypothetical protein
MWSMQRSQLTLPRPRHTRRTFSCSFQISSVRFRVYLRSDSIDGGKKKGYTRVILAGLSLYFMSYHPKYCTVLYVVSCLLDAVDGQAARYLGQTSEFGAVLDMVTDRRVLTLSYVLVCANALIQVHNIVPSMLPLLGVPEIRHAVSVPHRAGL